MVPTLSAKSGTSLLGAHALVGKRVSHITFAPIPSSLKDLVVFHILLFLFVGLQRTRSPGHHMTLNLSNNLMFLFLV